MDQPLVTMLFITRHLVHYLQIWSILFCKRYITIRFWAKCTIVKTKAFEEMKGGNEQSKMMVEKFLTNKSLLDTEEEGFGLKILDDEEDEEKEVEERGGAEEDNNNTGNNNPRRILSLHAKLSRAL